MKILVASAIFLFSGTIVFGQESFSFENTVGSSSHLDVDFSMASSHYLGEEMAAKMYLFKQIYTFIEAGTVYSPGDKVMVRKPSIFFAVRKLDKYYKKAIKSGAMEKDLAIEKLGLALDISIVIFYQETETFEVYLKNTKEAEMLAATFENVILE